LETGDDESKKGFLNFIPQKSTDNSTLFATIIPPSLVFAAQTQVQRFRVQRFKVSLELNP
jgi:hypothetical protein